MIDRLERDGFVENFLHATLPAAQRGEQIEFIMPAQAGADFAIRGQTDFVTRGAEIRCGDGPDETHRGASVF